MSDFFGLKQARSREAEEAIEAAEALMRKETHVLPAHLSTVEDIDRRLLETVPGHDAFWPRWIIAHPTLVRAQRGRRKADSRKARKKAAKKAESKKAESKKAESKKAGAGSRRGRR